VKPIEKRPAGRNTSGKYFNQQFSKRQNEKNFTYSEQLLAAEYKLLQLINLYERKKHPL